jgi:hypothetical protein
MDMDATEVAMSKLDDLFNLSKSNRELKSDLEALGKKMKIEGKTLQAYYEKELTAIAGKHGISLSAEDFIPKSGELSDSDLAAVAGGIVDPRPYSDPGLVPKVL